jgi:hypothetical protein
VLCVGTSYRAPNAGLFRTADLSLLQGGLPVSQPLASLPDASPTQLSTGDILFNRYLIVAQSCRMHLPSSSAVVLQQCAIVVLCMMFFGTACYIQCEQLRCNVSHTVQAVFVAIEVHFV